MRFIALINILLVVVTCEYIKLFKLNCFICFATFRKTVKFYITVINTSETRLLLEYFFVVFFSFTIDFGTIFINTKKEQIEL